MSEYADEIQDLMQSMTDLVELTPDFIQSLAILHSVKRSFPVDSKNQAMDLRDFVPAKITHLAELRNPSRKQLLLLPVQPENRFFFFKQPRSQSLRVDRARSVCMCVAAQTF